MKIFYEKANTAKLQGMFGWSRTVGDIWKKVKKNIYICKNVVEL